MNKKGQKTRVPKFEGRENPRVADGVPGELHTSDGRQRGQREPARGLEERPRLSGVCGQRVPGAPGQTRERHQVRGHERAEAKVGRHRRQDDAVRLQSEIGRAHLPGAQRLQLRLEHALRRSARLLGRRQRLRQHNLSHRVEATTSSKHLVICFSILLFFISSHFCEI